MIELGPEPLRQVGDPPRQGRPRRRPARRPRPDRRDRARGRLRRVVRRRRQRARRRDRHDEEHGLRVRPRAPDRARSRRSGRSSPATSLAFDAGRAGDGVSIEEHRWSASRSTTRRDALPRDPVDATRTAVVTVDARRRVAFDAGIADLTLMKTARFGVLRASRATSTRRSPRPTTGSWRRSSAPPGRTTRRHAARLRRVVRRDRRDAPRRVRRPPERVGPALDLDHRPGDPRAPPRGRPRSR